jgi:hypothetical protein
MLMRRNAVVIVAVSLIWMVFATLINEKTSGALQMRLASLLFGALSSAFGIFVLVRRKAIVQENVTSYHHSPGLVRTVYSTWYQLFRFKSYEAFALVNTIILGSAALMVGLLALGFFAHDVLNRP